MNERNHVYWIYLVVNEYKILIKQELKRNSILRRKVIDRMNGRDPIKDEYWIERDQIKNEWKEIQ